MSLPLVAAAQRYGAPAVGLDGWERRGRAGLAPIGVLIHHTASRRTGGDLPTLGLLVAGRADLSGPLGNATVGRLGSVVVIAGGVANHAGRGAAIVAYEAANGHPPAGDAAARGLPDTTNGNPLWLGIEIELDGIGEEISPAAYRSLIQLLAGWCEMLGRDETCIRHHRQWTRRKVDVRPDLPNLWADVGALLRARPTPLRPPRRIREMAYVFTAPKALGGDGVPYVKDDDGTVVAAQDPESVQSCLDRGWPLVKVSPDHARLLVERSSRILASG